MWNLPYLFKEAFGRLLIVSSPLLAMSDMHPGVSAEVNKGIERRCEWHGQLSRNKSGLKVKANGTERLKLPTLCPRILKDLFPTKSATMSWKFYVWVCVIRDNNLTHGRLGEAILFFSVRLFILHHYSKRLGQNLVSCLLSTAYIGSCLLREHPDWNQTTVIKRFQWGDSIMILGL